MNGTLHPGYQLLFDDISTPLPGRVVGSATATSPGQNAARDASDEISTLWLRVQEDAIADWPGWGWSGLEHVIAPVDALQEAAPTFGKTDTAGREQLGAILPWAVLPLEHYLIELDRIGHRISAGEVVTILISLHRGLVEAAATWGTAASSVSARWWISAQGRPLIVPELAISTLRGSRRTSIRFANPGSLVAATRRVCTALLANQVDRRLVRHIEALEAVLGEELLSWKPEESVMWEQEVFAFASPQTLRWDELLLGVSSPSWSGALWKVHLRALEQMQTDSQERRIFNRMVSGVFTAKRRLLTLPTRLRWIGLGTLAVTLLLILILIIPPVATGSNNLDIQIENSAAVEEAEGGANPAEGEWNNQNDLPDDTEHTPLSSSNDLSIGNQIPVDWQPDLVKAQMITRLSTCKDSGVSFEDAISAGDEAHPCQLVWVPGVRPITGVLGTLAEPEATVILVEDYGDIAVFSWSKPKSGQHPSNASEFIVVLMAAQKKDWLIRNVYEVANQPILEED